MLTEKDYCDYETCRKLESLGMNIYTAFNGVGVMRAILLCEAQKFLREEKKAIIIVVPHSYDYVNETHTWTYEVWLGDNLESDAHKFNSYEEALLEGIKEAIRILKEE